MTSVINFFCWMLLVFAGSSNMNTVVLPAPHTTAVHMIQPVLDEDPVPMRGHVKNLAGDPISGVSVKLNQGGQTVKSAQSDSGGNYDLGNVVPGNYQLKLSASGYANKTIDFTISAETFRTDTLTAL